MSENDPVNLRLYEEFYIRKSAPLEIASLHSIPGRNVVNSRTFSFHISEVILKHFQRSFVQRYSIIRVLYSIHSLFLQLSCIRHIFYQAPASTHFMHHTPPLHIYIYIYIYPLYIHPFSKRFSYREIYRQKYTFFLLHVRPCAFFTCYCPTCEKLGSTINFFVVGFFVPI